MEISLIIPTYNRVETLCKVIDSYISNNFITELVIINDASTVSYDKFINYIKTKKISFIYEKNVVNMGSAYCRNLGIQLATKTYILWGEDDAFISNEYIDILVNEFQEGKIVFGTIFYNISMNIPVSKQFDIIESQCKTYEDVFDYSALEGYYRISGSENISLPFGHALFLTNKSMYSKIKYYEKYWYNGYREETDVQVQFLKVGGEIVYVPKAICYHLVRTEIEQYSGQHKKSRILYEIFKVINNFTFLLRHWKFIKKHFNLKGNIITSMFSFLNKHYLQKLLKKML